MVPDRSVPRPCYPTLPLFALSTALLLTFAIRPVLAGQKWPPVSPEDLAVKHGVVDPEADAEALLWVIRVEDAGNEISVHNDVSHHLRIKVFTDRGREARGRVDIPYDDHTVILDLAARTVRPDGSVVEIKRDAMFERTIVKANGRKIKAKSFAVPNFEIGSIIEYRWTERRYEDLVNYLNVPLQQEFPVRMAELWIKPLPGIDPRWQFRFRSFNAPMLAFEPMPGGFQRARIPAIPAFRSEPRMPPEGAVRPWVLLYYSMGEDRSPKEAWAELALTEIERRGERIRVEGTIKRAAQEAVGNSQTTDEKLERIFAYCRAHVLNVMDDVHGLTLGDREQTKLNRSPAETLKRGRGTGTDINYLFAALAAASGLQTRLVLLGDRAEHFFDSRHFTPYFLDELCVAVWDGLRWRFFDPAARYTSAGMLPWWEEGGEALLLDREKPEFLMTPFAPPGWSLGKRVGSFLLSEDGGLEGDVRAEYSGHWGAQLKEEVDENSAEEREKAVREGVQRRLSGAEISGVRIEHASDPEGPYTVSYHVRVPGYGQRIGKRLIVEPAYFHRGSEPEFSSNRRIYPIYFGFSWTEEDSIAIRLPEGFEAEIVRSPEPVSIQGTARYNTTLAVSADGRTLLFRRSFEFGSEGRIYFPAEEYARLKRAFDSFGERDAQSVTLTRTGSEK